MYDPVLYHMDLSIFSYHIYAQTLVWPWDPFYEKMRNKGSDRRTNFMKSARELIKAKNENDLDHLNNSDCPDHLDPILSDYSRINPTKNCIFKPSGGTKWEVFKPIPEITDSLESGRIKLLDNNQLEPAELYNINGTDRIYFFEGKTGLVRGSKKPIPAIKEQKTILGFILERQIDADPNNYQLHITFRGSRSGNAYDAFFKGLKGKGNPDWVSDLQIDDMSRDEDISPRGKVSDGFSLSLKSAMDNIIDCLKFIHQMRGRPPQKIYTTGHSLGGALAGHFASMINNKWSEYNNDLTGWESSVRNINVFTYGAPVFGDWDFVNWFNSNINCKRIKVNFDPITSDSAVVASSGYHPGARIETSANAYGPAPSSNHEYGVIRKKIIEELTALHSPVPQGNILPVQEFKNFLEIPVHLYNGANCQLENGATLLSNLTRYLEALRDTLMDSKSYAFYTRSSTLNKRRDYINNVISKLSEANFNLNNADLLNVCNAVDEPEWRNFIYLCLIMSKISNGGDLTGHNNNQIADILKKI